MIENANNLNRDSLRLFADDITNRKKRDDFIQACITLKPADEILLLMQEQLEFMRSETLHELFS
jgi:hypothetical protein